MTIEETVTSKGLLKKIIYFPVSCRPCFDIGCRKFRCIRNFDITSVSSEIDRTLGKLGYGT